MKLPSSAVINNEKIKNYLLSPRKRNDKSQWLSKAGYSIDDWLKFKNDIRTQILILDAHFISKTQYGEMYRKSGKLKGPNEKTLNVCSIWMREFESDATKFITMYPIIK